MAEAKVPEPRVYTDERFPQLEVHNSGSTTFFVYELDPSGRFDIIDQFKASEVLNREAVSEEFARRRSQAYYDHMAKGNGAEVETRDVDTASDVPIQNLSQKLKQKTNKPPSVGLNPLGGMREMTQQDIDSVIAQARAETDPAKQAALKQQALSMMAQQESVAQRIVKTLLSL